MLDYTTTYTTTHIATSAGIQLEQGQYTDTDLLVWTGWAYMVAHHPMVAGDPCAHPDAVHRIARLGNGIVWDADISGLQDWAEAEGWTAADAVVWAIAGSNGGMVQRDMQALDRLGEADMESILGGYLWQAICDELGDMDEDTEDALSDAIVAYYEDMLD